MCFTAAPAVGGWDDVRAGGADHVHQPYKLLSGLVVRQGSCAVRQGAGTADQDRPPRAAGINPGSTARATGQRRPAALVFKART